MTDNEKKFWDDLKAKHPDALLLFRCGDFYETYNEDAVACATILGITLNMSKDEDEPCMAGFPHHALDTYLPKLVRAGKRVAICDFPIEPPKKRGNNETIETTSETKSEETMAKNLKAADLIGKTIEAPEAGAKYVVKSVSEDGTKLLTDYYMKGKDKPFECPITLALLEANTKAGKWTIEGVTPAAPAAVEEVEEVTDIKPEPAKTVDIKKKPEPKAKKKQEPKAKKSETKAAGKLRYETYVNKKGKTCAKIIGFSENDPAYVNAADLHGSATYERTKDGEKTYLLIFGPKYADAAKQMCDALNAGKSLKDCQAIVDKATAELAQKREERKATADAPKGYSDKDVAEMLKNIMAGGDIPEDIKKAMAA